MGWDQGCCRREGLSGTASEFGTLASGEENQRSAHPSFPCRRHYKTKLTKDPTHLCIQILALSRYYQIPIHVIQSNHPKIVAHSPDPKARATLDPKSARKIKAVRISYHRRLYGLGEHYVRSTPFPLFRPSFQRLGLTLLLADGACRTRCGRSLTPSAPSLPWCA